MSGEIRSDTMLCKAYIVEEIRHNDFKLRNPLKIYYSKSKNVYCVFVNELEIFVNSDDLTDAVTQVFEELFLMYETICMVPLYRTLNDEVYRYRKFLSAHIERIQ